MIDQQSAAPITTPWRGVFSILCTPFYSDGAVDWATLRDERSTLVILMGGALICLPGFVGDALGLLLMIGPVRHLLIRIAGYRLARRIRVLRPRRWSTVDATSHQATDWPAPPGGVLGPGAGGPP